jgi:hypothetical protein
MTPKQIAAIQALAEDLPGSIDDLTDALADWQDESLPPSARREAEQTILASLADLSVTSDALRAAAKL